MNNEKTLKAIVMAMGALAGIVVAGNIVNAFGEQMVDINQGFYISLMNQYYTDVEKQISDGIKMFYEQEKLNALDNSQNILTEMAQKFPFP